MTWSNQVTGKTSYRKGRYNGLRMGLIIGVVVGFIFGVACTSEADTGECKTFTEILESFDYDYHPRYELPPRKPTGE